MNIFHLVLALFLVLLSHASALDACSATYCGTNGPFAACEATGTISGPTVCTLWAWTPEARRSCAQLKCNNSCYFIPVLGSDGKGYCTPCHLHQRSCEVAFTIYGPVSGTTSRSVVSGNAGAVDDSLQYTERDSTRPDVLEVCSVGLCTSKGAETPCLFEGKVITCGKWAGTEEKKEQCDFLCPLFCLPVEEQPVDNTGRRHCSACQLSAASCALDFRIWGPVGGGGVDS